MPWVPLHESGVVFDNNFDPGVSLVNSVLTSGSGQAWSMTPSAEVSLRVTVNRLEGAPGGTGSSSFRWRWGGDPGHPYNTDDGEQDVGGDWCLFNAASAPETEFQPQQFTARISNNFSFEPWDGENFLTNVEMELFIEVEVGDSGGDGCFWNDLVGATEACTALELDQVQLWGTSTSSGGMDIYASNVDSRNTLLDGATSVAVVGFYWSNDPFDVDPNATETDLSAFDFYPIEGGDLPLQTEPLWNGRWWMPPTELMPTGYVFGRVSINGGQSVLAVICNIAGS